MNFEKNISIMEIERFLKKADKSFPVPLSKKQNLTEYAEKLYRNATLCTRMLDGRVVSMVAGYTQNTENNMAYIAVVATLDEARGKGYAKTLMCEFLDICRMKKLNAVHLYTVAGNTAAVKMYEGLGFVEYKLPNEPRANDLHLIFYLKKEETN